MRLPVKLVLVFSLCWVGVVHPPFALAQDEPPAEEELPPDEGPELESPPAPERLAPATTSTSSVTIPKASAIAIEFKFPINFDPKRQRISYPVTVSLAQPLRDSSGQVIAAKEALVNILFKPVKGGVEIEATSMVIGGRVIPIRTSPLLLPAIVDPEQFGLEFVSSPGFFGNVADALLQFLGSTDETLLSNEVRLPFAAGLALFSGITTPRPVKPPPLITITEGNILVLTLADEVKLPAQSYPIPLDTPQSTGEEEVDSPPEPQQ